MVLLAVVPAAPHRTGLRRLKGLAFSFYLFHLPKLLYFSPLLFFVQLVEFFIQTLLPLLLQDFKLPQSLVAAPHFLPFVLQLPLLLHCFMDVARCFN